jgi:hypothetical protein
MTKKFKNKNNKFIIFRTKKYRIRIIQNKKLHQFRIVFQFYF